jgi:type IX secretion system PorP/SprF family membrane protein
MKFKFRISDLKLALLIIASFFSFNLISGQQVPLYPISYRIFNPFIFNPAIAGSKDFFSIDIISGKNGRSNSLIGSVNGRLSKSGNAYFSSSNVPKFTNFGVGGLVFNELNGLSRNTGVTLAGSYHFQIDENELSFISVGVAGKAVNNHFVGIPELGDTAKNTFFPNLDLGVYYYSPGFYAGLSVTNLLGDPDGTDTLGLYSVPVSLQLFFQVGYRIVVSKSLNIVLEPSLIVNSDDSFSLKVSEMIEPALKLYAGNFCLGTYFNDFNNTSFFFQYKYPGFSIGTYFALPNNSPFYKKPLMAEITLGINISAIKSGSSRLNHW